MSYEVNISSEAQEDLRGIYAYIAFNLLSPLNAKGQIIRLNEAIRSLDEFPLRYKLVNFEPWKSLKLHVMVCDNYLVFYLVNEKSEEVLISRVLYGKRNIVRTLDD